VSVASGLSAMVLPGVSAGGVDPTGSFGCFDGFVGPPAGASPHYPRMFPGSSVRLVVWRRSVKSSWLNGLAGGDPVASTAASAVKQTAERVVADGDEERRRGPEAPSVEDALTSPGSSSQLPTVAPQSWRSRPLWWRIVPFKVGVGVGAGLPVPAWPSASLSARGRCRRSAVIVDS